MLRRWVPGKIVEVREQLSPVWQNSPDIRGTLLLDVSLESFFRTKVEAVDPSSLTGDDALSMLELVLRNHCVSAGCTPEAAVARGLLAKLLHEPPAHLGERWSQEWALHARAVLDNVSLAVRRHLIYHARAFESCFDAAERAQVTCFILTGAMLAGKRCRTDSLQILVTCSLCEFGHM